MPKLRRPFPSALDAHPYRLAVGQRLQAARERMGLSQTAFGEMIGIKGSFVSCIERGRGSIPPERYPLVCRAMGEDPREFAWFLLEHSDPWLYAMLTGETDVPPRLMRPVGRLKPGRPHNRTVAAP